MTLEQINNMTLEDNLRQVIYRLVDTKDLPEGEVLFKLDDIEGNTLLQSIIMTEGFNKPLLRDMNAELEIIKEELRLIENSRLAEIARVEGIKTRWNAIEDIHGVLGSLGSTIRNPALELKRIIEENDQDILVILEDEGVSFKAETDNAKALKQQDDMLDHLLNSITGCIKIIAKFNIANALTSIQKDSQEEMYSDIFTALKNYRPGKFKGLLTSANPDGVFVTQSLKDELLNYLTGRGI